jgi:hypothetical protein
MLENGFALSAAVGSANIAPRDSFSAHCNSWHCGLAACVRLSGCNVRFIFYGADDQTRREGYG